MFNYALWVCNYVQFDMKSCWLFSEHPHLDSVLHKPCFKWPIKMLIVKLIFVVLIYFYSQLIQQSIALL